jgi:hypothetical protein
MLPPGLHSQQAGTILPTLMLIPPAMPPGAYEDALSVLRARSFPPPEKRLRSG